MKKILHLVLYLLLLSVFVLSISSCHNPDNTTTTVTTTLAKPSSAMTTTTSAPLIDSRITLHFPDKIEIYTSFDAYSVFAVDGHTLQFLSAEDNKTIALTTEQVLELNTLYDQVTDFSKNPKWGSSATVTIADNGETHSFGMDCANQEELNEFIGIIDELYCSLYFSE